MATRIYDYIADHPDCRVSQIMEATGQDAASVWNALASARAAGTVIGTKPDDGPWTFRIAR